VLMLLIVGMLFGLPAQDPSSRAADVTLVVEPSRAGGLVTCNGKVLDPTRVVTGLDLVLRATNVDQPRMFLLLDENMSLDKTFEIASLIDGVVGAKDVRVFAFSRKTGVMMEITPSWDRWKLSFEGKLEKKPL
jgi:hypothetical protein